MENRLLGPMVGLLVDKPIEGGLPADDTVDKFLAEAAIGAGESRTVKGRIEQVFHKMPGFALE